MSKFKNKQNKKGVFNLKEVDKDKELKNNSNNKKSDIELYSDFESQLYVGDQWFKQQN